MRSTLLPFLFPIILASGCGGGGRAGPGILDSPISVRLPLERAACGAQMEQEDDPQEEKKPLG